MHGVTREQARAELWRRLSKGLVTCDFLLHSGQRPIIQWLRQCKAQEPWLSIGRQAGKTTGLLAYILEEMWKHPGALYVWTGPHRSDIQQIVTQKLKPLLTDCPSHLLPKVKLGSPVTLSLPNGAVLELLGLNNEKAASFRGRTVRKVIVDEASEVDNLDSDIDDVLMPGLMVAGDEGQLICSGTPSKYADHESYPRVRRAFLNGAAIHATSHVNPLVSKEYLAKVCESLGGPDSPTWKREYLAQLDVTDPAAVLVPEWTKLKAELTQPWARPEYYPHLKRLVSIDRGGDTEQSDGTGLTFWTYDFPTQTAVVERAFLLQRPSTREIIDLVKQTEAELWPGSQPPARIGDGILAKDFASEGLVVGKPNKDDRDSAIALLRTQVGAKKLRVLPEAEVAIVQLEHAHNKRGKLARGKDGHFDVFDSILYANRYCYENLRHLNPIPPALSLGQRHGFRPGPGSNTQRGPGARALAEAFSRNTR